MPIGPMVPLTTVANPIAARILVAHLGAEGIVWELRGNVDGPYPVGPVDVLVAADDLDLARELLVDPQPLPVPAEDVEAAPARGRHSSIRGRARWVVLVAALLAAAMLLGRLLALAGAH